MTLKNGYDPNCTDPSCPICTAFGFSNAGEVKLSPKPIAISRWDHPEEWLRQYLTRERQPVPPQETVPNDPWCHWCVYRAQHPKTDVTHGWEGLDDETFTFFGVLRDGRVDESGYIE